ncbi:MAG: DUF3047 domain-containing protein [Deltaproteobacteria bacterium]|nr:DUF3047 domain-containing protein [Deltaproteobacteria bacterium]
MVVMVLAFLLLLSVPLLVFAEDESVPGGSRIALANFDTDQPLTFPQQWQIHGDEDTARTVYKVVAEEGNQFLRAYADKQDVQIGISRAIKAKEFPHLRWRWRAKQLPTGANERAEKTNDSVASVYVIFDSKLFPRAIKYVWSSSLPIGTRFVSPVYWRSHVVVLQSGLTQVNEWKLETVNFYHDYKALFGSEPSAVLGFAVLTDSDMTSSIAEADYDDFAVLSEAAASAAEGQQETVQLPLAVDSGQ